MFKNIPLSHHLESLPNGHNNHHLGCIKQMFYEHEKSAFLVFFLTQYVVSYCRSTLIDTSKSRGNFQGKPTCDLMPIIGNGGEWRYFYTKIILKGIFKNHLNFNRKPLDIFRNDFANYSSTEDT